VRLREVLTALIDEAKINHWDALSAVWQHQPEECRTCRAAIGAQTALAVNFVDVERGDKVRIGNGTMFGVVDHVGMVVDVRVATVDEYGATYDNGPIGRFNATALTRMG
jgi:hypothetical protein